MSDPSSIDIQAALKQIDAELQIMLLVTGTLEDGSAHYAYASIPPSKYQAFKQAEEQGNYDLAQFATILAHGSGLTPPEHVQREMEEKHGADHMFEAQLKQLIENLPSQPPHTH